MYMNLQPQGRDIFAYQQTLRRSMRRGIMLSKIMTSMLTINSRSAETKKENIELNNEQFEGPSFKLFHKASSFLL